MAIVSRDDLTARINALFGESATDEQLSILEDFTDTFTELESHAVDSRSWEQKYMDLDASWRKKYRDRFEQGEPEGAGVPGSVPEPEQQDYSFESLFKEEE